MKMVTECLRLQEKEVDFLKIFMGVAPHTPPVGGVTPPTPSPRWPSATCPIIIRRPASALLDKLLCPPGPGGPAAAG